MPRGELELPAFQGCVPAMLAVLGIDLHIAVGVAGRALFVQRRKYSDVYNEKEKKSGGNNKTQLATLATEAAGTGGARALRAVWRG